MRIITMIRDNDNDKNIGDGSDPTDDLTQWEGIPKKNHSSQLLDVVENAL